MNEYLILIYSMNIAILFSGRIIGFETTLPLYHEHIFKNNNVHIFIAHNSYNKEDLEAIQKNYSNVHIISELYVIPDDYKYVYSQSQVDPKGYYFLSMWYNRNKACEMMNKYSIDNNIDFDCVISARLDALVESYKLSEIHEGILYVPSDNHFGGLNDHIAIGTMNTINTYCNCYNFLSTVRSSYDRNIRADDKNTNPENILNNYINTTKLTLKKIPLNYYLLKDRHIHNKDRR